MEIVVFALTIIYLMSAAIVFLYSMGQLSMMVSYYRAKKRKGDKIPNSIMEWPMVTIQLPIYNELYVVERLINNIVKLDYPKDRLEIQVLDDSTDQECIELASRLCQHHREQGDPIEYLNRNSREGFKSGALMWGLQQAKGEFIAIFDSDFLPQASWLRETIPYFERPEVGVVQTRWGHINRDYSALTKAQAFALDMHFTLEQTGRNESGWCQNFNGTAGIWRKECIVDAGNWSDDTLTEDLDLSYRAQLKHWKIEYLEDVVTPAELPMVISAARSQQFRWNKGGAQNLKKHFRNIIDNKELSLGQKFHALIHLSSSSLFLNLLILALVSVPLLYLKNKYLDFNFFYFLSAFFGISIVVMFFSFRIGYQKAHERSNLGIFKYAMDFIQFLIVAMGLTWHNSKAVLEGLFGRNSEFIRTPKFNLEQVGQAISANKYLERGISRNSLVELFFLLYFIFGIFLAITFKDYSFLMLHIMMVLGFGYILSLSFFMKYK